MARGSDALSEQIAKLTWWHHIQVGPYVTPGHTDLAHQEWVARNLPTNFLGARVLDVGAWDGYFSFLAEERGAANVVAIDRFRHSTAFPDGLATFRLARDVRRSHVDYHLLDVVDVSQLRQKFDIVLFLGVYYHLKDPILALSAIHEVLAPNGIVFIEGLIRHGSEPLLRFYHGNEIEPSTYCAATVSGIRRMCEVAGFSGTELVSISKGFRLGALLYSRIPQSLRAKLRSARKALGLDSALPRAILVSRA